MPFDSSRYLQSSDNFLPNTNWVSGVYHHSASSFYDWEIDNEPILDLESRTDYLYDKIGGSLPDNGVVLVVSAGPHVQPTNGLRFFETVQAAIDALPNHIDQPVFIEVAVPGNLGTLKIKDFSFGVSGGIEIVNRYFAKPFQFSGASFVQSNKYEAITGTDIYLSSIDMTNTIASTVLEYGTDIHVNSGWDTSSNIRSIVSLPEVTTSNNGLAKTGRYFYLNMGGASESTDFTPGNNKYKLMSLIDGSLASWWSNNYTNIGMIPTELNHRYNLNADSTSQMVGLSYANYFSGVEISNCGGPVYIRDFFIDGHNPSLTTPTKFTNGIGLKINNCNNLIIENCTISRFATGGCRVLNSDVVFNKGFITSFNFTGSATGEALVRSDSYGVYANNSNITFNAVSSNIYKPADCPFIFAYNEHGIKLDNSKLNTNYFSSWATDNKDVFALQICNNFDIGLEMNDSFANINCRLASFLNNIGVKATNSELTLADFTIDNNSLFGVNLFDSTVEYNKNYEGFFVSSSDRFWARAQYNLENNGQNMYLSRSTFTYTDGYPHGVTLSDSTSDKIGIFRISKNFILNGYMTLPSVFIESGSILRLANVQANTIGFTSGVTDSDLGAPYFDKTNGGGYYTKSNVKGSIFSVDTGSTLELHGTKAVNGRTTLLGPSNREKQRKISGIHADHGSKVFITGPTTVAQFGVGIQADNGSNIEISPHYLNGIIDLYYLFALLPTISCSGNHTDVEIHSTKSCLFADRASNIILKNLGDYNNFWGNSASSYSYNNLNSLDLSAATVAGGIKFYANTPGNSSNPSSVFSVGASYTFNGGFSYKGESKLYAPNDKDRYLSLSRGGMCVTAQRGSHVTVKNVHFPADHYNPSSVILDENSSSGCGMVYGWAIDNDSSLNASYCSIKGTMPVSAGNDYHGPKMLFSGLCGNATLSGAPPSTPDTWEISILDSFGPSASVYVSSQGTTKDIGDGGTSHSNRGPFRLFFTPTGKAKFLGYANNNGIIGPSLHGTTFAASGVWYGEPYQILAQGYNPPIDLSSTYVSSLGSLYPEMKMITGGSGVFAYVKDYLSPSYKDRIVFDESAMDTFANAKNAITGKSNRIPLLTMVSNKTDKVGEGSIPDHGKGLISLTNLDLDKDG